MFIPPELHHEASLLSLDEKGTSATHTASVEAVHLDSRVDVAAGLLVGHANEADLTPQESSKLRAKIDRHILPLLCLIYTFQFVDKGTLASSSILGLIQDNHLTTDDYNTLGSAFYIGFLIFAYPQNWALQRLPVGKWLTFNIFLWSLFLGLHPLCHNFGGLLILRLLLGASEVSIMAGLLLVTNMFHTRTEIGERIGWTSQCNGFGTITSGFISFAVYHVSSTSHPNRWQWLMTTSALATLSISGLFLFFFPDNSTNARFLTEEEKLMAVKRVQGNQNGIETKAWKKSQFIEALRDAKTWLFFLFAAIADLQSGIGVQYSLVIQSYGFTTFQTTLLNIPSGVSQIIGITLGCYILRKFPNSRAWINIAFWFPLILAALIQLCLPISNRAGHLVAIYILNFGGSTGFVLMLSWVASSVSGHTKRLTTNGIFLIGYALGQILCTQFWKLQYRPRDLVPWGITLASYFVDIIIVLAIRHMFVAENKRRDMLKAQAEASGNAKELAAFDDFGFIEMRDEKGGVVKMKVEKAMLDLTDKENLAFRYVL